MDKNPSFIPRAFLVACSLLGGARMKKIGECSTHLPYTIGRQTEIEKAREMMHEHECHHLPVLEGGKLVGMISSTDLANLTSGQAIVVDEIMTDEPLVVDPDTSVKEVVEAMLKNSYGSAIVSAKEGSTWAIFTSIDAMKLLHEVLP